MDKKIGDIHRALILQGGGSLGAYEAGAYKAIIEELSSYLRKLGKESEPIFHIVAGTSIGAINAAIIVSYVKEKKTWEGSAEKLVDFWEYLSAHSYIENIPYFKEYWDYWHRLEGRIASGESARRYFSTKEFIYKGVPNVFRPKIPISDNRFFNPSNTWYLYDSKPLKESLIKFAKFPLSTSFENNEPRLLLVAVDVQEGLPVVFDSYEKEDGTRKSEYGRIGQRFEHFIRYEDGIKADFVMASASVPVNYDYTMLNVENYSSTIRGQKNNNNDKNDKNNISRRIARSDISGGLASFLGRRAISKYSTKTGYFCS